MFAGGFVKSFSFFRLDGAHHTDLTITLRCLGHFSPALIERRAALTANDWFFFSTGEGALSSIHVLNRDELSESAGQGESLLILSYACLLPPAWSTAALLNQDLICLFYPFHGFLSDVFATRVQARQVERPAINYYFLTFNGEPSSRPNWTGLQILCHWFPVSYYSLSDSFPTNFLDLVLKPLIIVSENRSSGTQHIIFPS